MLTRWSGARAAPNPVAAIAQRKASAMQAFDRREDKAATLAALTPDDAEMFRGELPNCCPGRGPYKGVTFDAWRSEPFLASNSPNRERFALSDLCSMLTT